MKRIILVLAAIISLFASLSLAEEEYISISSDKPRHTDFKRITMLNINPIFMTG